jgi:hypothetical protein
MLEPCDGKLSRTVLRGEGSREAPALPGKYFQKVSEIFWKHQYFRLLHFWAHCPSPQQHDTEKIHKTSTQPIPSAILELSGCVYIRSW